MPPVVQVDRAALWEVELPSLERHRERSPFGKDCSLSLCILEVGDTLWGRRSLEERMIKIDGDIYMFLDLENQYCENKHITQSNLQIQCNPYEITSSIFHII